MRITRLVMRNENNSERLPKERQNTSEPIECEKSSFLVILPKKTDFESL